MRDMPRWGPASKQEARQLVVLCHGLGADGFDLIDLAPSWGKALPDAAFVAPHAPLPHESGFGRQWFSLDDRSPAVLAAGVRAGAAALGQCVADELNRLSLPPDAVALMGFSQGAMTALFAGLRRSPPPRAILAFSGMLLGSDSLATELAGRPPVLLVHGEDDAVVPAEGSRDAERRLAAAGVPVEAIFVPRLGHGIDETGIAAGARVLQSAFAG